MDMEPNVRFELEPSTRNELEQSLLNVEEKAAENQVEGQRELRRGDVVADGEIGKKESKRCICSPSTMPNFQGGLNAPINPHLSRKPPCRVYVKDQQGQVRCEMELRIGVMVADAQLGDRCECPLSPLPNFQGGFIVPMNPGLNGGRFWENNG